MWRVYTAAHIYPLPPDLPPPPPPPPPPPMGQSGVIEYRLTVEIKSEVL